MDKGARHYSTSTYKLLLCSFSSRRQYASDVITVTMKKMQESGTFNSLTEANEREKAKKSKFHDLLIRSVLHSTLLLNCSNPKSILPQYMLKRKKNQPILGHRKDSAFSTQSILSDLQIVLLSLSERNNWWFWYCSELGTAWTFTTGTPVSPLMQMLLHIN